MPGFGAAWTAAVPRAQTGNTAAQSDKLLAMNIVLGITGGIAAYKTPELVRRLRDRGADVQILHDSLNYGEENDAAIRAAGLEVRCRARRGDKSNKHNKFIVLTKNGKAQAAWTGPTNISAGGIFGHSNVAGSYLVLFLLELGF